MPRTKRENATIANLGPNVRHLREQQRPKKWTQEELADRIGNSMHMTTVSRIEKGGSAPSLEIVARMAEVFGVTIDALVRDKRPEAKTPDEIEMDDLTALVRSLRPEVRANARWLLGNLAQGKIAKGAEFSDPPKITPVLPDQSWTKPEDGT